MCQTGFKSLYGIFNNKFAKCVNLPEPALTIYGNIGNSNAGRTTACSYMSFWMEEFATLHGNYDPKKAIIHIPAYIAQVSLYDLFAESWKKSKYSMDSIPAPSTYYSYLDIDYGHLQFLCKTRLGRCSFCITAIEKKATLHDEVSKISFEQAL